MNYNGDKFVDFDIWCPKCRHEKKEDAEEPCRDCLESPANRYSTKPVCWEEKTNDDR